MREPLEVFLNNAGSWGVYRIEKPDSLRNQIVDTALMLHQKKVPFDMDFSLETKDEIYCTELISICVSYRFINVLMSFVCGRKCMFRLRSEKCINNSVRTTVTLSLCQCQLVTVKALVSLESGVGGRGHWAGVTKSFIWHV